jgi:hypothetical protein
MLALRLIATLMAVGSLYVACGPTLARAPGEALSRLRLRPTQTTPKLGVARPRRLPPVEADTPPNSLASGSVAGSAVIPASYSSSSESDESESWSFSDYEQEDQYDPPSDLLSGDDGYVQQYDDEFGSQFTDAGNPYTQEVDFHSASDDFWSGIVIEGPDVVMKIGGYVKVDMIHDFDPIDTQDLFDTTSIPVGAPPRTNTRFHARQSRLNFDARWLSELGPVRVFVEADFFGAETSRTTDTFRLRHAFAEVGRLIVGRTWTTLTDPEALPNTLDFEGAVSSISRRQAQVRWTQPIFVESLKWSVALEDSRIIIEPPSGITGSSRTPSPDLIARLRWSPEWGQFQIAGVARELGYQPTGGPVFTEEALGLNFTGAIFATEKDKVYYQILFGDGIGSFRGLPDAAPRPGETGLLGTFAWMMGWTHDWTDTLSSNFTYSENRIDNTPGQDADDLRLNNYLAVNLIHRPAERMFIGVEYLYGVREDVSTEFGVANRIQVSCGYFLP